MEQTTARCSTMGSSRSAAAGESAGGNMAVTTATIGRDQRVQLPVRFKPDAPPALTTQLRRITAGRNGSPRSAAPAALPDRSRP